MICMMKKKVLVTGAGGMLGEMVEEKWSDFDLLLTGLGKGGDLVRMDITDYACVTRVVNEFDPDVILHLAALTDLEFCEENEKLAYGVNADSTGYLAKIAKKKNAKFVYVSSANVFGGYKEKFYEFDKKNPVNVYGATKLEGERLVEKVGGDFLIVRAGWMVGKSKNRDKKFLSKILDLLKDEPNKIHVVNDTFGSLTFTDHLVEDIGWLIKNNYRGFFHSACQELVSRYDMVIPLVEKMEIGVEVVPVGVGFFVQSHFAQRPKYEGLVSKNPMMSRRNKKRNWKEGIESYLENSL